MAASLMCRGVGKWGSAAPKSTRLAPWARSLAASAATAMVAETSIRPIRAANTCVGAAAVVMLLIFTDFGGRAKRASQLFHATSATVLIASKMFQVKGQAREQVVGPAKAFRPGLQKMTSNRPTMEIKNERTRLFPLNGRGQLARWIQARSATFLEGGRLPWESVTVSWTSGNGR